MFWRSGRPSHHLPRPEPAVTAHHPIDTRPGLDAALDARLQDLVAGHGRHGALARFPEGIRAPADRTAHVHHRLGGMLPGAGLVRGQDEGQQCPIDEQGQASPSPAAHAARDARASPPFPVARMLRDRPGPACGTGMPTAWPGVRAKNGLAIAPRHRRSDARAVLFCVPRPSRPVPSRRASGTRRGIAGIRIGLEGSRPIRVSRAGHARHGHGRLLRFTCPARLR